MKLPIIFFCLSSVCSHFTTTAQTVATIYNIQTQEPIDLANLIVPDSLLSIQDSLLRIYMNGLARSSRLSYDSIRRIEQDTAYKIIYVDIRFVAKENGVDLPGTQPVPLDDAELRFIFKERTIPDLRKH